MDAISLSFEKAINYISTIGFTDCIDILIVAWLIYEALMLVRKNSSYNLSRGIIIILLTLWLSEILNLTMINYLLRKAVELGLIALVILFQPELRRLLERMGGVFITSKGVAEDTETSAISQTVIACGDMSDSKTGALIIFERKVNLNDTMLTGTVINADVNSELLKNLFFNKAPLHDGAVIIRDGRIVAAGCMLPLTKSTNLSKDLGMRHRAGIGMSEQSDAVVVIVSEETGSISIAMDGMLKRHLNSVTLEKLLRTELIGDVSAKNTRRLAGAIQKLRDKIKGIVNEN